MGIVNVTPDSFSDGGQFLRCATRPSTTRLQLAADGADLLDIGGESTRPYAEPVDADEELRRVLPVIEQLAAQVDVPISIDTSKAAVARAAIDAGAEIINDVTGLTGDPEMIAVAVETGVGVCAMHMQGTPQTMQDNPTYDDVVAEVREYLRERRDALVAAGIARERICLDPGIGFGKTHEHNIDADGALPRVSRAGLSAAGRPLAQRVSWASSSATRKPTARTRPSARRSALAVQGVQIVRVHDVRPVREALLAFEATRRTR